MFKFLKMRRFHKTLDTLVGQGNYSAALDHINQLASEKLSPDIELYKIWLMLESDQMKNDPTLLDELEKTYPKHPIVLLLKGEYLFKEKQYLQSKAILEQSLALDPHNLRAEYSLAKACLALGEIDRATHLLKSTVQYDPKLVQSKLLALTELLLIKNQ